MATCEACKTIPPVVATDYTLKGEWTQVGDLKVYVTGSPASTKAIVDIYDIFGLASQTLQGADLLAAALDVLVLVPDFFRGEPALYEWFSVQTEENNKSKDAFLSKCTKYSEYTTELLSVVEGSKKLWPSVESWGAFGLCWGGKITALNSSQNTLFKVSGQIHPGMLAKEDAEKITIPHIVLASNGEDPVEVKAYAEVLAEKGKFGEVETYDNMHHGWMGARADLENEANIKEYTRGYTQLATFFSVHL